MKTIYNENKYAERALITKKIDTKNGLTLSILCKYYYFEKHKNKQQIIRLLSKFLDECNGDYDKGLLPELIDKYTDGYIKIPDVKSIRITLDEVAKILSRESDNEQHVMFAILVAYKFKNERIKMSENMSVYADNNTIKSFMGEFFKDAKVKPTQENKRIIMGSLYRNGFVIGDNVKRTRFELTYVNEDSPTAFVVEYQNDIWVDLGIYKGNKNYKRCECCGSVIKLTKKHNGDTTKYCSDECKKHDKNEKNKRYYYESKI